MKRFNVTVNGKAYDVAVEEIAAGSAPAAATPVPVAASVPASAPAAASAPAPVAAPAAAAPAGASKVESPMPGTILDVKVTVGQSVEANQVVVVLEAMKMENDIVTPKAGTVAAIHVKKGDSVNTGTLLVSIS